MPSAGRRAALASCLAAALLTGCGATAPEAPPVGSTGTATAPAGDPAAAPDPPGNLPGGSEAAHGHTDADHVLPEPLPSPTWDEASRTAAVAHAEAAVRAFARPDLTEERWMAGLAPLLTPAGAVAHQGTDPANVAATRTTGPGVLADDRSAYLALVAVPTDAGAHEVLLVRAGGGRPWRAERISAPEEAL